MTANETLSTSASDSQSDTPNTSPRSADQTLAVSADGTPRPVAHAMLAAFAASQFALISGFWYGMIGLSKIDWSRFSGHLIAPEASDVTRYLLGYLATSINGFVFGLAYAFLIRPLLPLPSTRLGNFITGQLVGVGMSVVGLLWWTPGNFPDFHPGFFSHGLGMDIIIGTFVWHGAFFLQLTSFLDALGNRPWSVPRVGPAARFGK
ncbi:hypothetical protein ABZ490_36450 [Streptomyces sp. NPDC005811]|uniref:hypothetical protein n=1 Tax=Streptomyces sp. NPDC005811 TaxID=3154565 RepID=UPI00340BFD5A